MTTGKVPEGKKALFCMSLACACLAASAGNFIWNGGAGDGLWTSEGNWDWNSGYPSSLGDIATFTNTASATIDTGNTINLDYMKVAAGTVTIDATAGSAFNSTKAVAGSGSGLVVASGATLVMKAPLALDRRFDKWEAGELVFRDCAITNTGSATSYFACGPVSFEGSTEVVMARCGMVFGNGKPYGPMPVNILDSTKISATGLGTGGSTAGSSSAHFVQNGTDTVVSISGNISLARRPESLQRYTLKSGTLSANKIEADSLSPTNLQYVQEGGTSTFASVQFTGGSGALRGGLMRFTTAHAETITMGEGTHFDMAGGILYWPGNFNPASPLFAKFRWSGNSGIAIPNTLKSDGKTYLYTFTWDWSRSAVVPGFVFVYDIESNFFFGRDVSTYGVGLEVAPGRTVAVDANSDITAPRGSLAPWKLILGDGSTFKLQNGTARVSVPLDLEVHGTGRMWFNGFRGVVVAHRLVVDGVEKAKGRHRATGNSFLYAGDNANVNNGASIFVPTVWTGEGGDNRWSNPDNWDDNTVPNGTTAVADISRATSIVLDEAVTLDALIAMPNGMERKVSVSGSGSITLNESVAFECAIYVAKDCELDLGVDLLRNNRNVDDEVSSMLGGGRLTVRKKFPAGCSGSKYLPWMSIDGTLAVAGSSATVSNTGYDALNMWGADSGAPSEFLIEDGVTFNSSRLWVGFNNYVQPWYFRQTGGTSTWGSFYLNCGSSAGGRPIFYLEGGTMTVGNGIGLNIPLAGDESGELGKRRDRYPGGSFEMSGGKLVCNGGFASCGNQNYVRLYGGDVDLNGNMDMNFKYPSSIKVTNRNDYVYYLGGVKIKPKSAKRELTAGNIWLDGRNGDCTIDVSEQGFYLKTGNTVAGPGGLVITGSAGKMVETVCAMRFTGKITIRGGELWCYSSSTVDGPCELIVENADSKAVFGHGIANILERIELVQDSNLSVSAGQAVTTKRLIVGGVDVPAGEYVDRFGAGTVTVLAAPASWLVGDSADLSREVDGATHSFGEATNLSSLVYAPAGTGHTNTLSGADVTFLDGATIHVTKGNALVVGNDVVLGGKVSKTGEGEVFFNGSVTAGVTPAASVGGRWLVVREGGATFDGAVKCVRLATCGTGTLPVITLNQNCSVTDYAIVLTAWGVDGTEQNVIGETRQNGATVDYSGGLFDNVAGAGNNVCPFSDPYGGFGRYVINSGTLTTFGGCSASFLRSYESKGSFEFVQNGGVVSFPASVMFTRASTDMTITYTLNDGELTFGGTYLAGYRRDMNFINLNGGSITFANSTTFAERQFFTVSIGGDVTFRTATAAGWASLPNDYGGVGRITIDSGTFSFGGMLNVTALDVKTGATVEIGEDMAVASDGGTDLVIAKTGALLQLGNSTRAKFKTLKVGNVKRVAGVYSTSVGATSVRSVLSGEGEIEILEGTGPGTVLQLR